jgi:hypothetical protein
MTVFKPTLPFCASKEASESPQGTRESFELSSCFVKVGASVSQHNTSAAGRGVCSKRFKH